MKVTTTILLALISIPLYADGFVSPHFGLSWPGTLSEVPSKRDHMLYDVGVDWGGTKSAVSFMGRFNIIAKGSDEYQTISKKSSNTGGDFETVKALNSIRRRIISLGAGISINPMKNYAIHPVMKASLEPSVMILLNDDDIAYDDVEVLPPTGAYRGTIKRLELELHAQLKKGRTVFVGAGYQFGYFKKRINYELFQGEREYIRQSMNGISLRLGFCFR